MSERHDEFTRVGAQLLVLINDSMEQALAYFQQHAISFPCLVDPGHEVYDWYGVGSRSFSLGQRPGLFVIDREAMVRYAYIGWQQWEIPGVTEVLKFCRSIPCETAP